jgi:hypothetical protein
MEKLAEEIEESMEKKRKEREIEGSSNRYLPNLCSRLPAIILIIL